jgi:hypothetical protein
MTALSSTGCSEKATYRLAVAGVLGREEKSDNRQRDSCMIGLLKRRLYQCVAAAAHPLVLGRRRTPLNLL